MGEAIKEQIGEMQGKLNEMMWCLYELVMQEEGPWVEERGLIKRSTSMLYFLSGLSEVRLCFIIANGILDDIKKVMEEDNGEI